MRALTVEEIGLVGGGSGNDDFMTGVAENLVAAAVIAVVVTNPVAVAAAIAINLAVATPAH
jgi:hypothetical protein